MQRKQIAMTPIFSHLNDVITKPLTKEHKYLITIERPHSPINVDKSFLYIGMNSFVHNIICITIQRALVILLIDSTYLILGHCRNSKMIYKGKWNPDAYLEAIQEGNIRKVCLD